MKRKLLSALLAALMLASFAGCSSKEPERGSISNETGTKAQTADTTAAATDAATTEAKLDYTVPTTEGNTYTSKTLGVKLTLDEGWAFASDEDMAQLNQAVVSAVGDDYAEQLKDADIIYDMSAANETTGDNISINFENLGAIYGKVITPETYIDLSKDTVKDMLTSMGCENVEMEVRDVDFAGQTEKALHVKTELSGVSVYELCVVKSCGDHMANITITTMLEDTTDAILAKFTPAD